MRMAYCTLCFREALCGVMANNSMTTNLTSGPAYGVRHNTDSINQVSLNRSQEVC